MASNLDQYLSRELKEASEKVKSFLEKTLTIKKPETLYEASIYLIKAGGKMLRPYLTLKSCETVGGETFKAIPVAAAIEMLHTFTLIHDDIMDEDPVRRGVPSVHVKWGLPTAIMAGDLLFAKVYEVTAEELAKRNVPPEKIVKVVGLISKTATIICEGQTLDMSFAEREDVSEKEYLEMIKKKTSSLFKTSAMVGGLIGGGLDWQTERLGEYGELLGVAFQIVDDVLGLEADEKTLGKPVGSDLREGKKTLPIIFALKNANQQQKKIVLNAMRENSTPKNILEAKKVIEELGSISYATKKAEEYIEKALEKLKELPENQAKKSLENLARFVVERKF
ncbi:MAG: polyprenyl synthetase family protein [Candidatus Hecatellales archaeon]|nr:MAG: polyprenyl synthetase family protein [Candidatus Hecatellales archaeon]